MNASISSDIFLASFVSMCTNAYAPKHNLHLKKQIYSDKSLLKREKIYISGCVRTYSIEHFEPLVRMYQWRSSRTNSNFSYFYNFMLYFMIGKAKLIGY